VRFVSPVFRHGRLRLYLLKLLDEAPRHGYEVIRLLQDRFMGVYAPSPGTIYPRLARLEEDGLVTHEEVDGKKVYSITDKGREEIRARLGDLADLEDELSESLRDVAREISVDVRETVRNLREELASAAREFRFQDTGKGDRAKGAEAASGAHAEASAPSDEAGTKSGRTPSEEATRIRDEARRARERMREDFRAQSRSRTDWAGWSAWSDWASGKDWAGGDWMGGHDWPGRKDRGPGAGRGARSGPTEGGQGAGPRARRGGPYPFSDLERMAIQFANELRAAAKQTGNLGERSLNDLRDILTDTLAKVRDEVFSTEGSAGRATGPDGPAGSDEHGIQTSDATPGDATPGDAGSGDARSSDSGPRDASPGQADKTK
jgi:DNA-binding PadR family transcriptional regulator